MHSTQLDELGVFYPEDFGAVGDGVADDTLPLQAAIDAARNEFGVVQLGSKCYRITIPLNTRLGRFTIRGRGWWHNIQELYDGPGAPTWENYRTNPYDALPTFGVAGTVIYCDGCAGLTRDPGSSSAQTHSFLGLENLALVGKPGPGQLHAAVDFGSIFAHTSYSNLYRNVLFARWNVGVDLSLHYYGYFDHCEFVTCKEAVRNGVPGTPSKGGNVNHFVGCLWESCDRALALYSGGRLDVFGSLVQNHKQAVFLKPNVGVAGGPEVGHISFRSMHVESSLGSLLVLDPGFAQPDADVPKGVSALMVTLEQINVQGGSLLFDFGDGAPKDGSFWSQIHHLYLRDVHAAGSKVAIPEWITRFLWEGGKCDNLTVNSPHAEVMMTEAFNGYTDPVGSFSTLRQQTVPAIKVPALPSSQAIEGRNLSGSVTISDMDTNAGVTFLKDGLTVPERDPFYNIMASVQVGSGTPSAGAYTVKGITNKAETGFTLNLLSAPGLGSSVTYQWMLVR